MIWDTLCHRCGECCFEKIIDKRGRIITTQIPCRFLDIHSRLCRVYHQRTRLEEDCIRLTPDNIDELIWLPETCGYVQFLQKNSLAPSNNCPQQPNSRK
ncbi:MAG: hypothetical protein C0618_09050 [Desulfuromonas sp.]|nr:MAG: hypothetical protein C0618_09050 [Desulfuromonas sp.]